MADGRPLAHLDADLGNDCGGHYPINAGDAIKQLHLARVGFEFDLQFRVHLLEVTIKPLEPIELGFF